MRRKVRIVSLPKAGSGMEVNRSQSLNPGLGYNGSLIQGSTTSDRFAKPDTKVNRTLKAVPREEANLEAEKGETAFTDLNGDGIPEQYMIGGKRHYDGGTPLYLPDNSFIFSRDRTMKIKDPTILAQFGMSPAKSGYTPADIAKKYDINKFRKVLGDPDSDPLQRKSAEAMISNYNMKLGKLALIQESIKGFPNGIPAISMPYIEQAGIDPASFIKGEPNKNQEQAVPQDQTEAQFEEPAPDQARYGTNVLSQLQKRKFGGSNKRKVKVILPKHQTNGSTGINLSDPANNINLSDPNINAILDELDKKYIANNKTTTTGKIKFKTEEELYSHPNYRTLVKSGNAYMLDTDGKYHRVNYAPAKPNLADLDITKEEVKQLGNQARKYAYFKAEMKNPKVKAAIIAQYKANLKGVAKEKELSKKTDSQIIEDFMAMQKQNFIIASDEKIDLNDLKYDNKNSKLRANYEALMTEKKLPVLTSEQIASGQLGYIAFDKASKDSKTKDDFAGLNLNVFGVGDEDPLLNKEGKVSKADGVAGNTTLGQFANAKGLDLEPEADAEDNTLQFKNLAKPAYTGDANFWAQDIIKTLGAAGDMARIKKYRPWQATPDVMLPDPTFYDPTRELAAGQESANTLVRGLSAFTGPQALSSRTSAIQGQAATAAANTLGKYANLNVGVANQFELQKTSILNQASQNKAALATQLYDKNTVANQTFDNSKAAARQNIRGSYIDAITNKANTYNLNSLYPQYAVDPLSGGKIDFTHGAQLDPDVTKQQTAAELYQSYFDTYPSLRNDPAAIVKLVTADMKLKDDSDSEYEDKMSKLQKYMSAYENSQLKGS
jgi:hypothetical protein